METIEAFVIEEPQVSQEQVISQQKAESSTSNVLSSITKDELRNMIREMIREELDYMVPNFEESIEPSGSIESIVELPFMFVGSLFISFGLGIQRVGKGISGTLPKAIEQEAVTFNYS